MQPVWGYFLGTLSFNGNTDALYANREHEAKQMSLICYSRLTLLFNNVWQHSMTLNDSQHLRQGVIILLSVVAQTYFEEFERGCHSFIS